MNICIDNRERDRIDLFLRYIKSGKTKFIDGIETGNYPVGDYLTKDNLIGIEYKKDDLITSIFDGKIDQQLKELRDTFRYPFLFIGYEGIMDTIAHNPAVNPDAIIGKFASILARQKVTIMFVGDLLVPFVCKVCERFYDGQTPIKDAHYSPIRRKPTSKEIRHAMIENCVPNIGPLKTNHLLEKYDIALVSKETHQPATIEDLMEIKGVGKKLSDQIMEIFK